MNRAVETITSPVGVLLICASLAACGGDGSTSQDAPNNGSGETTCDWPDGPYGVAQGNTVPQHLVWEGYAEGTEELESIPVSNYFDCDASNGIRALLFITAVFSCEICQAEAAALEAKMADWEAMGIRVITLLLDSPDGGHPQVEDAKLWKDNFDLKSVAVVIDPNESFVPVEITGTPQHTVVDPRTMEVVLVRTGSDDDYAELVALATMNSPS